MDGRRDCADVVYAGQDSNDRNWTGWIETAKPLVGSRLFGFKGEFSLQANGVLYVRHARSLQIVHFIPVAYFEFSR